MTKKKKEKRLSGEVESRQSFQRESIKQRMVAHFDPMTAPYHAATINFAESK